MENKISGRAWVALGVAALIFISGCVGSIRDPGGTYPGRYNVATESVFMIFSNIWSDWVAIAIMMLMLAVLFVGLAYMVSFVIGDEALRTWSKMELVQVFLSALVITAALAGVAVGTMVMEQVSRVDPQARLICPLYERVWPCHVALGINYLDILFMSAEDNAKQLITFNSYLMPVATLNFNFSTMVGLRGMRTTAPFMGLTMMGESLASVFDMLVKTMIAIRFQQFILDMIVHYMFPALLVMGLLLRILFFTRKLGGLLIALALSLYFVLPTMYAMNGWVLYSWAVGYDRGYDPLQENVLFDVKFDDTGLSHLGFENRVSESRTLKEQFSGVAGARYGSYRGNDRGERVPGAPDIPPNLNICVDGQNEVPEIGALERFWDWFTDKVFGIAGAINLVLYIMDLVFLTPTGAEFFLGPNGFIGNLAKLFLFSLVIPFIGIMATIASTKALSPMLGGDVEIAGLTHLV